MPDPTPPMIRSVFDVPGMDCPTEERIVRMSLDGVAGVAGLEVDLAARRVAVLHRGDVREISGRLEPLGFGARLVATSEDAAAPAAIPADDARERRTLRRVLAINAAMFVVELAAGWIAESSGLVADSLDMLADASVYALALYAVGRAPRLKLRAAHASGLLQAALALGALADVTRRAFAGSAPEVPAMIGVSLLALAANVVSLALVSRHRAGGAHMRASVIFSTNDVLANLGVIAAGALVAWTGSRLPDLAVGTVVALLVLSGGVRILRLR
ncbi:MAG TPA: cation transporter [Anaeromyxobacter sp.]